MQLETPSNRHKQPVCGATKAYISWEKWGRRGPETVRRFAAATQAREVCKFRVREVSAFFAAVSTSDFRRHPPRRPHPTNMATRSTPARHIYVGTAGWTIPRAHAEACAGEGSHLERYARAMNCVEINSTFYRPHQARTFERWAATTPANFRFAVKAPKLIAHTARLCRCGAELAAFFDNIRPLGAKLGVVLVQLPPKLAFDEGTAREFLETLRELHTAPVVIEPRHASWFTPGVSRLLREFEIARAMADPPAGSALAAEPGGWPGLRYFRLHGSPIKYRSEYTEAFLRALATKIQAARAADTWVIFDNTAGNHALGNALTLRDIFMHPPKISVDPKQRTE
jgi:uncharacterized protein YecE (DUF72 family)